MEGMSRRETTFATPLLAWFRRRKRDLPWRRRASPYSTWISEVMLQQTVVKTVVPYFERWMERYPDVAALARARESDVLRLWEGLGYYHRARALLASARIIVDRHGGAIPSDYDALRALPGIGDYTASAILSIAFGRPLPVLDGNVKRVVSRLLALRRWTGAAEAKARAWLAASISRRAPGAFNEALMELGATVCRPGAPDCPSCPVAAACRARRLGLAARIPARKTLRIEKRSRAVAIVIDRDRVLLEKRGLGTIASGLWGLPGIEGTGAPALRRSLARLLGARLSPPRSLGPVIHRYTRFEETLHPFAFRLLSPPRQTPPGHRFVPASRIHLHPLPSAYRRVLTLSLRSLTPLPERP